MEQSCLHLRQAAVSLIQTSIYRRLVIDGCAVTMSGHCNKTTSLPHADDVQAHWHSKALRWYQVSCLLTMQPTTTKNSSAILSFSKPKSLSLFISTSSCPVHVRGHWFCINAHGLTQLRSNRNNRMVSCRWCSATVVGCDNVVFVVDSFWYGCCACDVACLFVLRGKWIKKGSVTMVLWSN